MRWFKKDHTYSFVVSRCERIDNVYHFILRYQGKESTPLWAAQGWKFSVPVSKNQELYPLETFEGKKLRCRVLTHKAFGFPLLKQEVARYTGVAEKIKSLEGSYEPSRKNIDSLYKPKVLTFITVKDEIVEHVPDDSLDVNKSEVICEDEKKVSKDKDAHDESNASFAVLETAMSADASDEIEEKNELTKEEERFNSCLQEAKNGNAEAQFDVSMYYKDGMGVEKDISQAIKWCKKSARGGYDKAVYILYKLGECYESGISIDINEFEAFACYKVAAEQKMPEAQYKVAEYQLIGRGGCEKNIEAAVKIYLSLHQQEDKNVLNRLWEMLHNSDFIKSLDERELNYLLARCYDCGWGVACNDSKAMSYYGKVSQKGGCDYCYADSLYNMGAIYERNNALGMAKFFYRKAKNAGHTDASEAMRRVRVNEQEQAFAPIPSENTEARAKINSVSTACSEEDKSVENIADLHPEELTADEMYQLGMYYLACKEHVSEDWQRECELHLLAAAEQNHVEAQYVLGTVYMDAEKVPSALSFFKMAAAQGHAEALYNMGVSCELGVGAKVDLLRAFDYFKSAAEHGMKEACYKVGVYYMEGEAVDADDAQALVWLKKAADAGHVDAAYRVGLSYLSGKGGVCESATAMSYLVHAAEAGMADAMYLVALGYDAGVGVEKNMFKALMWYEKAADSGLNEAVEIMCSPQWIIRKIQFSEFNYGH